MGEEAGLLGEVRGLKLSYDDNFEGCLIDQNEARAEARQARNERVMTTGIEAQIKVTGAGGPSGPGFLEWGRANRKLSPSEAKHRNMRELPTTHSDERSMPAGSLCSGTIEGRWVRGLRQLSVAESLRQLFGQFPT